MSDVYTIQELCTKLGRSPTYVWRIINYFKIPYIHTQNGYVVNKAITDYVIKRLNLEVKQEEGVRDVEQKESQTKKEVQDSVLGLSTAAKQSDEIGAGAVIDKKENANKSSGTSKHGKRDRH